MKTVSVKINLLSLFRSANSEICLKKKTDLKENRKKLIPTADKYERKDILEYWNGQKEGSKYKDRQKEQEKGS